MASSTAQLLAGMSGLKLENPFAGLSKLGGQFQEAVAAEDLRQKSSKGKVTDADMLSAASQVGVTEFINTNLAMQKQKQDTIDTHNALTTEKNKTFYNTSREYQKLAIDNMQKLAEAVSMEEYNTLVDAQKSIENQFGSFVKDYDHTPFTAAMAKSAQPMPVEKLKSVSIPSAGGGTETVTLPESIADTKGIILMADGTIGQRALKDDKLSFDDNKVAPTGIKPVVFESKGVNRKPTTQEEYDRWFNEMQGLKAKTKKTQVEKERQAFLENGLLAYTHGKGEVANRYDEQQVAEAGAMGSDIIGGNADKYTRVQRLATEEGLLQTKTGENLKKPRLEFMNEVGQVKAMQRLDTAITEAVNNGYYQTGAVDNFRQWVGELTPSKFREMSTKSNDEIMKQARLEGRLGAAFANYLKEMSGTAASEAEAQRILKTMVGSPLTQEDIKAQRFNEFVNERTAITIEKGKRLVSNGLTGETYNVLESISSKTQTLDSATTTQPKPQQNYRIVTAPDGQRIRIVDSKER